MFETDKPIFNPIHELIIIFGDCGVGKSSLIAHFIDVYLKIGRASCRERVS